jgi:Zn-dependent peptidase ImmA (M78 family)
VLTAKLNDYERLVKEVSEEVPVIEANLYSETGCYGLYRNGRIYIEKKLKSSQKRNVLAEEYGHYKTSAGTILNQNVTENRKQEKKARNFGLEKLVTLDDLIKCSEAGLTTHFACADFLGINIKTLQEVITYYYQKYGTTHFYKGYILEFREQSVMVLNTGLV